MALNLFPRRREAPSTPTDPPAAEPGNVTLAESPAEQPPPAASRGRRRRPRSAHAASTPDAPAAAVTAPEPPAAGDAHDPAAPPAGRRRRRSRGGKAAASTPAAPAPPEPGPPPVSPSAPTEAPAVEALLQRIAELADTVREQSRQIDRLARMVAALAERPAAAAPPAKVGVFVDVANIELAAERARVRLDWGDVLSKLTRGRQLIRAVAYAPVHDDPQVSPESQRFVEPFLDKGYKIVTKPLRRFADGTIKANVDIEMALDIVTLADRLDIVVLVSGDGDFAHLVEALQARGVRVEVVGFEQSTASVLRNAADRYIDIMTLHRAPKAQ